LRYKMGISIVVSTIVLATVSMVVAVAVVYWMGDIAGLYTRFQRLEITSAHATYSSDTRNWTATINLKNPGTEDVTINSVLINGKPLSEFNGYAKVTTTLPLKIKIGQEGSIKLQLNRAGFNVGTTIEIRLLSAIGQGYSKPLTLN